jgi:hypothetical protein
MAPSRDKLIPDKLMRRKRIGLAERFMVSQPLSSGGVRRCLFIQVQVLHKLPMRYLRP